MYLIERNPSIENSKSNKSFLKVERGSKAINSNLPSDNRPSLTINGRSRAEGRGGESSRGLRVSSMIRPLAFSSPLEAALKRHVSFDDYISCVGNCSFTHLRIRCSTGVGPFCFKKPLVASSTTVLTAKESACENTRQSHLVTIGVWWTAPNSLISYIS
ncbi:hypothetical protein EVAR_13054_1 [Eumeta japonica]|uniref:Uncharacterized protein n=1 Tax=Eumeta variegata TaxID=151549 RepID=A0A4C1VJC3_EUMVA|nr:hypothetical protein EVAR_13054_1 [Eumeta japonica]